MNQILCTAPLFFSHMSHLLTQVSADIDINGCVYCISCVIIIIIIIVLVLVIISLFR